MFELHYNRCGCVVVLTSIMLYGCTEIYTLERRTVNAETYCQDIIELHVCSLRRTTRICFMLIDDNALCHTAALIGGLEIERIHAVE